MLLSPSFRVWLDQSMPKNGNFSKVSIPRIARVFKFCIKSTRTLSFNTWPICTVVTTSPTHPRGDSFAPAGALCVEQSFSFSFPGSFELTQVISEPVSTSQVHFTPPADPNTWRVDLSCVQGCCGCGVLSFAFDTSGGPEAPVSFSLKVENCVQLHDVPILCSCNTSSRGPVLLPVVPDLSHGMMNYHDFVQGGGGGTVTVPQ